MSKSYQKKKNHKPQPPPADLEPIQIDEMVVTGQTSPPRGHQSPHLMQSIADLIETMEELGLGDAVGALPSSQEYDIEAFESRIQKILDSQTINCNQKNLKQYLKHLKTRLQIPCYLTGREDFPWEEEYVYGEGSQQAYEQLKQTYPSHTDQFKLLQFSDQPSADEGILVEVQRTCDQKKFTLPLAALEVTSSDSPDYPLVEDYCIWFINYA